MTCGFRGQTTGMLRASEFVRSTLLPQWLAPLGRLPVQAVQIGPL
jgi:hypothetical protein